MFPMEVLQGIAQHRLSGISGTPTAFRVLCDLDSGEGLDLASVRYAMSGGQFLDIRLVGLIGSLFPRARVVNMYGCSENSPRISYHHLEGRSGMDDKGYFAVGRPVQGTSLRVVSETGDDAAPREVGEVLISGESLMRCYWKDPEATGARIRDGWFHTQDLGYLDAQGLLHLTGRKSAIINVGNEKVSPEEVEKVLLELPEVREVVVYGASDPLLGESVQAQVVLEPGHRIQLPDLQRHCRKRVSGYKVPRRIQIVETLQKTHYGKVDRKALRGEDGEPDETH
jgi:acyl-CoA synthetase (AMP-forming)/AMP-acid ligase II